MKLYLYASFGNFNEIPAGGGQTSARRLKITLERLGIVVLPINRHRPQSSTRLIRIFELYWAGIIDIVLLVKKILFGDRKDTAFLFIGYSGSMLPLEFTIGSISKMLGYKTIYFLKGGGSDVIYKKEKSLYKCLFRTVLKFCTIVLTEGEVIENFIRVVSSKSKTFYLPNYTENGFAPDVYPRKPEDQIGIVYLGRICQEKNVLLSIEIFDRLCMKFHNIQLTIIGNGDSGYEERVEKKIEHSYYSKHIRREGKIDHEKLKEILRTQHIFLFPSNEPREGHSNALNEAMSWGLVPVVSKNNFLPSIVGDMSLVAQGFEPDEYVRIIAHLIDNRKLLEEKSKYMYERVKMNFTQSVVEERLKTELVNLFE